MGAYGSPEFVPAPELEAFVQGVSTRKMEKLARSLGIENRSRSQVSADTGTRRFPKTSGG